MQKTLSRIQIILVIVFTIPLAGAGVDIHVPSLPYIIHYFHASQRAVQNSVTLYLLGYGFGQLIVGTISDSFGRRYPLLIGLTAYVAACLLSVFSPSIHVFLISRFIQGMAIAGPGIAVKACLSDCFSGRELQKVSAYVLIAWAAGPILAPALGGYLQHYIGWRACFGFLAIYAILIFVFAALFLPETKTDKERFHLSVICQNTIKILSDPVFIGCIIGSGICYSFMATFNVMGPFLIQTSLHYSPIEFGYTALLLGVMWFVGTLLTRLFVQSVDSRVILSRTIFILFFILLMAVIIVPYVPFSLIHLLVPLAMVYVMGGLLFPCTFGTSLSLFPTLGGMVNAISGVCMMLITSLMTVIASHLSTLTPLPLMVLYFSMSLVFIVAYVCLIREKS